MSLELFRKKLDKIDKKMAELFEERMQTVFKVAEYKQKNNLPTYVPNREQDMLNKNSAYIKDEKIKPYYKEFLMSSLKLSKDYQEALKDKK